jgi:hypothetical protein
LVEKLKTSDFNVINGVLKTVDSIFKRFRDSYEADAVQMTHLKYSLESFTSPFLYMFKVVSNALFLWFTDLDNEWTNSIARSQSSSAGNPVPHSPTPLRNLSLAELADDPWIYGRQFATFYGLDEILFNVQIWQRTLDGWKGMQFVDTIHIYFLDRRLAWSINACPSFCLNNYQLVLRKVWRRIYALYSRFCDWSLAVTPQHLAKT